MPLVDGPDCAIWIEVEGDGDPVTVVAHGITSSIEEIAPFVWRTPGTRVLFDFRGHGRSESPPLEAGYGWDAFRRDLEFVANSHGATRALGVSLGSGAMLNWLADEPDRFERLVFFIPSRIDANTEASKERYPMLARLLESRPLEEVADWMVSLPESQLLVTTRPAWRELLRARVLRMNGTGIPRALRAISVADPPVADENLLRRVTAPTLVLGHENDPLHPAAVARRLGELLPNAEVRIWEDALGMLDDFGAFAEAVGAFLGAGATV